MNALRAIRLMAGLLAVGLTAGAWAADEITGFTVLDVQNECTATTTDGKKEKAEKGKAYTFGTTLETGRNSTADLQFSEGNVFRLLARTRLVIAQDVRDLKLKKINLTLETGSVKLDLDKFPPDHKLQVETPTAVCGAVGTRFAVSFEYDTNEVQAKALAATRKASFACEQGATTLCSKTIVKGKEQLGQSFNVARMEAGSALQATIHEGLENTFADITVNRGKLTFDVGGKGGNSFVAEPVADDKPSRFVCALEKAGDKVKTAAIEVKNGKVDSVATSSGFLGLGKKTELTSLTSESGAVLVQDQAVMTPPAGNPEIKENLSGYLTAAENEGQLHSKYTDLQRSGQQAAAAAMFPQVQDAATKATLLRSQLVTQRTIKLMQTLRNVSQRPRLPPR